MQLEFTVGIMAILCGLGASYAQWIQIKQIWKYRSTASLSGIWLISFLAACASLVIHGVHEGAAMLFIQGILRTCFMVVIVSGYFLYGPWNRSHVVLSTCFAIALVLMLDKSLELLLFLAINSLCLITVFKQAWEIHKKSSRGVVVILQQVVLLMATACWAMYGALREDWPLVALTACFSVAYAIVIFVWLRAPATIKSLPA